jgi:hypothetical protein
LTTTIIARNEDVITAALSAGEALSLELKKRKIEEEHALLQYYYGKESRVDLRIERRTNTLTSILFDVGRSGSIAFGRLMA